jgi:hypothetical protein
MIFEYHNFFIYHGLEIVSIALLVCLYLALAKDQREIKTADKITIELRDFVMRCFELFLVLI